MMNKFHISAQWALPIVIGVSLLTLFVFIKPAAAITPIATPDPKPGSFGLEATKTQPAPTQAPTITTPGNGASFSTSPVAVNGICQTDLLVQVYDNGVMVGAVMCAGGSFSVQVTLFAGTNELSAIQYDSLEQASPVSNTVTVTYTDVNFKAFGALVTLTSSYGRRSAPAGTQLTWPLQLSGGTGPYAFSIDWGDGSTAELKSQPLAGIITLTHTYKKAGIFQANIKVTDVNGVSAFLQVIAVASGQVDSTPAAPNTTSDTSKTTVMWIPAVVAVVFLFPAYWLGRRSQIVSLKSKMLKERNVASEE